MPSGNAHNPVLCVPAGTPWAGLLGIRVSAERGMVWGLAWDSACSPRPWHVWGHLGAGSAAGGQRGLGGEVSTSPASPPGFFRALGHYAEAPNSEVSLAAPKAS